MEKASVAQIDAAAASPRNVAISRDGTYAIVIEADAYRLWKLALNGKGGKDLSLFVDNLPAKPLCVVKTATGFRIYGPLRSDISKWILGPESRTPPMIAIDVDTKGRFLRARRHAPAIPAMMQSP